MNSKNLLRYLVTALFIAGLPSASFALSLDDAKAKGLVGETPTGYLAAVSPSTEVNTLISDINSKRKVKYQEIANKNGTPLPTVEALAGKKAIENTASGQFVMSVSSQWQKK